MQGTTIQNNIRQWRYCVNVARGESCLSQTRRPPYCVARNIIDSIFLDGPHLSRRQH